MTDKKTPQSQIDATRRWEKKNLEKTRRDTYKRTARTFVRHYATEEELVELIEIYKQK